MFRPVVEMLNHYKDLDLKQLKLTKIKGCCLTEDSTIICPSPCFLMICNELLKILHTIVEEVLDPGLCLGQVQQRFGDFITNICMISGFVWNLHQLYLIRHGVILTVAITQCWWTHLQR